MARNHATNEQYRVVSSGGTAYGPYPVLSTARSVRSQKEATYSDSTFIIERASVKWAYVE